MAFIGFNAMPSPHEIDSILPQTQCGLCGYKGCMPYAEALANKTSPINLCPPGGVAGLLKIAALVNEDPQPFILEMEDKAKPKKVAHIREAECIGCTKCIQACPVDAIMGAAKLMHTVITIECTGCDLCIAPCPVDCIDMVTVEDNTEDKSAQYRKRYLAKQQRLELEVKNTKTTSPQLNEKKSFVQAALLRAKAKKNLRGT